jgi:hypothetical protein
MKTETLTLRKCKHIPHPLEPGVLYYSEEFQLANHLCACGWCNAETVTPVSADPKDWQLKEADPDGPTLEGSIGNFQMPCKSHYWVRNGKIVWCP